MNTGFDLSFDLMQLIARVESVSSGKLFATMLLHIPYCEKWILVNATPLSPPKGWT